MSSNFLKAAMKPVTSVKTFLRDSADNSIKYKPESGKKHIVYIPFTQDPTTGEKSIIAIANPVHSLTPGPNKYEAFICQNGIESQDENGNIINDGSCPFCDRLTSSWDIYKFKMEKAKQRLEAQGYSGEELDNQMKAHSKVYNSEREVKEADPYIYMLIAQYKLGEMDRVEIGPDGLPVFELKVMKLSDKAIAKIQETLDNSNVEFEGSEVAFKYKAEENRMLVAGSRTVSPILQGRYIDKYPMLLNAINAAVSKWTWEGIEKAFREWTPCSTANAKKKCDDLFRAWDAYCADPSVGFLESSAGQNPTQPALETKTNAPVGVNVPLGDSANGMPMPGMSVPNQQAAPQPGFGNPQGGFGMPQPGFGGQMNGFGQGMPDPSAVFSGGAPQMG